MNRDIVVIADPQVTPDSPTDHLYAVAKYIWHNKPAHVVHIGDHWDFPSISSYNTAYEQEGRRLADDLIAGAKALDIINDYLRMKNAKAKRKAYKPTLDFIIGNHEQRLDRLLNNNPYLHGMVDMQAMIEKAGWTVHPFLQPLWINGIAFNHYMQNPMSGRAIGGSIENKLNKHSHSFVHGHQQQYQFGRRQTLDGRPHFGVCAGSFYLHDESYREGANTEIRGFVHLKAFTNRYGFQDYDVDFVSIERLLEMY